MFSIPKCKIQMAPQRTEKEGNERDIVSKTQSTSLLKLIVNFHWILSFVM